MNNTTYQFTAYKGMAITTERDYSSVRKAVADVRWYQKRGWFVDYIDDSMGRVARVIDRDAIRKSNELLG